MPDDEKPLKLGPLKIPADKQKTIGLIAAAVGILGFFIYLRNQAANSAGSSTTETSPTGTDTTATGTDTSVSTLQNQLSNLQTELQDNQVINLGFTTNTGTNFQGSLSSVLSKGSTSSDQTGLGLSLGKIGSFLFGSGGSGSSSAQRGAQLSENSTYGDSFTSGVELQGINSGAELQGVEDWLSSVAGTYSERVAAQGAANQEYLQQLEQLSANSNQFVAASSTSSPTQVQNTQNLT
jgi:hypothetical protein